VSAVCTIDFVIGNKPLPVFSAPRKQQPADQALEMTTQELSNAPKPDRA
jgi:hypothetical protein